MAGSEPRAALPLLLSLNAGFVDTAGFLALQGLFTAHVTGNFVTLGASLALGTSGAIAKLLALPVFCAVVIAARLLGTWMSNRTIPAFEVLLGLKVLLLIAGAVLAIVFGPFHDGDSWRAILTWNGPGRRHGDPERGAPRSSRQRASVHPDDGYDNADHDRFCRQDLHTSGRNGPARFPACADVDQRSCLCDRVRRGGRAIRAVRRLVLRAAADLGSNFGHCARD